MPNVPGVGRFGADSKNPTPAKVEKTPESVD
jgi:hypothetical protein